MKYFTEQLRGQKESLPNNFFIRLGKLIREARIEANMTHAELAASAYFSQTAISQIKQRKRDVSAVEIFYFNYAVDNPV